MRIDERYCGPPGSANGGYACGITAAALGPGCVEVTLVAPPPLGRDLELELDIGGDEARLLDGGSVVAVARPGEIGDDERRLVRFEQATEAAASFDVDAYRGRHAFPSCFTCGPDRAPGDGLRLFPAPTTPPGTCAWPWVPEESVDEAVLWAALDCPSGLAWPTIEPDIGPFVLGRMAAIVHRQPARGERLVVVGWTGEPQGRKRPARSAMYDEGGGVVAEARTTWILLNAEQQAAFAVST